jgi:hypothetical protein
VESWLAACISAEKPAKRPTTMLPLMELVRLYPASFMAIAVPLLLRIHAVEFMFWPSPWKFRLTLNVVALAYTTLYDSVMLTACPPEVPLNCSPSAENALRRGTTLASVEVVDVLDEVQEVETALAVLLEVVELLEDFVELLELEIMAELVEDDEELVTMADEREDELMELETIKEELEVVEEDDLADKASYAPIPTTPITTIAITAMASGAIPFDL